MSRTLQYTNLEPTERRIAMMHVAGASLATIAEFLQTSAAVVLQTIHRPKVADYIGFLTSHHSDSIEEVVRPLNEAIEETAVRAFEVEKTVMERLFAEDVGNVRAQLGAAATAQDILDRAGARAPTKSINVNAHMVSHETIEHLANVLEEITTKKEPAPICLPKQS